MSKSHYFEVNSFLTDLHDGIKSAKTKCENFYRQVESHLLTLEDEIDFAASNDSNKIGVYMKLCDSVESKRRELETELSNDNSSDIYQGKVMGVEGMRQEQLELQKKREEQLEKLKDLKSVWHEKNIEMMDIQKKVTRKFRNLKRLQKLYENKFNIALVPGQPNSYRLEFPSTNEKRLFVNLKWDDSVLELENINTETENQTAILREAHSSADSQGLLALMNSIRLLAIGR